MQGRWVAQACSQYTTEQNVKIVQQIAKRNGWPSESRLPESKALPPIDVAVKRGKIDRLRPGEVAAIGWQFAPECGADFMQKLMRKHEKKRINRARYERMCGRSAND